MSTKEMSGHKEEFFCTEFLIIHTFTLVSVFIYVSIYYFKAYFEQPALNEQTKFYFILFLFYCLFD